MFKIFMFFFILVLYIFLGLASMILFVIINLYDITVAGFQNL